MSFLSSEPSRQLIIKVLLWYRLLALAYVALLIVSGLRNISVPLFVAAIIYTIALLSFRQKLIDMLLSNPYLIVLDVFISYLLVFISGVYETPYFLYSFAPLFLGSFILKRPGYNGG